MSKVVVEDIQKAIENMALYPFVHVSALELHALSRYPSNRQNDRQKHQQTTVCLRCACAPRHKNKLLLAQQGNGMDATSQPNVATHSS